MIVKTLKKHLAVLSVLLVMTPAVYAQKVTAEFRNTPVADVLKEIEKQTGCSFVYKTSDIKEAKASGSFKDAPLADVLLKVITPPLTYSIEGNIIAISNDSAPKAAREQSSRLKVRRKGVIRDVSGDPLVGASVYRTSTAAMRLPQVRQTRWSSVISDMSTKKSHSRGWGQTLM